MQSHVHTYEKLFTSAVDAITALVVGSCNVGFVGEVAQLMHRHWPLPVTYGLAQSCAALWLH